MPQLTYGMYATMGLDGTIGNVSGSDAPVVSKHRAVFCLTTTVLLGFWEETAFSEQ